MDLESHIHSTQCCPYSKLSEPAQCSFELFFVVADVKPFKNRSDFLKELKVFSKPCLVNVKANKAGEMPLLIKTNSNYKVTSVFSIQNEIIPMEEMPPGNDRIIGMKMQPPIVITLRKSLHFSTVFIQKQNQSYCLCSYSYNFCFAFRKCHMT